MKDRSGESLAEAMGRVWGILAKPRFLAFQADLMVPIPLHWLRKWKRGYNQAAAIARGISDVTEIPFSTRIIKRTRQTPIQPLRSSQGRRENVRDAFHIGRAKAVQNKRVLLIDDVFTTGSTVNEAARVLLAAGAAQVSVAVVAHG
ncbi:MAG: phosphoribosyltransferase family protein [Gemmataceae bacterium]